MATRPCANCGAPLAPAQDWCLQCGSAAPASLLGGAPRWRPGAAVLAALALLVAGAAGAAYAALSKSSGHPRSPARSVAQAPAFVPPASTATPGTVVPGGAGARAGAPSTVKPTVPLGKLKIKLPGTAGKGLHIKTPAAAVPIAPGAATGSPSIRPIKVPHVTAPALAPKAVGAPKPGASGGASSEAEAPSPIVLDTNAAATYDPYAYPVAGFGDPRLAIDGDPSTGWSARVDPAVAPRMAEGLIVDLKTPQKLSALTLTTSTPGMTVQVYGASGTAAPSSITDPAWKRLSPLRLDKKRQLRIALLNSSTAFRFVVLWISRAPASALGTPQAPGRVSVNELELFAAQR